MEIVLEISLLKERRMDSNYHSIPIEPPNENEYLLISIDDDAPGYEDDDYLVSGTLAQSDQTIPKQGLFYLGNATSINSCCFRMVLWV
jgi:hypothetical protein